MDRTRQGSLVEDSGQRLPRGGTSQSYIIKLWLQACSCLKVRYKHLPVLIGARSCLLPLILYFKPAHAYFFVMLIYSHAQVFLLFTLLRYSPLRHVPTPEPLAALTRLLV